MGQRDSGPDAADEADSAAASGETSSSSEPEEDSELIPSEQPIPLTEASFQVGVSVQALRQRIKRGTLAGSDAVDSRGMRVAGILPSELRRAFPQPTVEPGGATRSKAFGAPMAVGMAWQPPQPAGRGWDGEADLERGGMAPPVDKPPAPVPVEPDGGWSISPWSIGLVVAMASVAVAGLLTGAREARAADRTLDDARIRETQLRERLRDARTERDAAVQQVLELTLEIEELRSGR